MKTELQGHAHPCRSIISHFHINCKGIYLYSCTLLQAASKSFYRFVPRPTFQAFSFSFNSSILFFPGKVHFAVTAALWASPYSVHGYTISLKYPHHPYRGLLNFPAPPPALTYIRRNLSMLQTFSFPKNYSRRSSTYRSFEV